MKNNPAFKPITTKHYDISKSRSYFVNSGRISVAGFRIIMSSLHQAKIQQL